MNIITSIWLSSGLGAVLFFASGRFWGRRGAQSASLAGSPEVESRSESTVAFPLSSHEHVVDLEGALPRGQTLGIQLRQALDELSALEQRHAESQRLATIEIERHRTVSAALEREIHQLRATVAQVSSAREHEIATSREAGVRQERAAWESKLATSRRNELELTRQLADARREAAQVERLTVELRDELSRREMQLGEMARVAEFDKLARNQLEAQIKSDASETAGLRKRNGDLVLRLRVFEQRQQEFEARNQETTELQRELSSHSHLSREAAELRQRVSELEARGNAQSLERHNASLSMPRAEGERLETRLERGLDAVRLDQAGCETATLSDVRGLLIASSGDRSFHHELAAAGALTSDTARRLGELVPVGPAMAMELRDENGLVLRTQWIRVGEDSLLVSTMTRSQVSLWPVVPAFDQLVSTLQDMLLET